MIFSIWRTLFATLLFHTIFGLDSHFAYADADFFDVRTSLSRDRSGKKGDSGDKYFHESTFNSHYDGRFGDAEVSIDQRLPHLTALIQTFLAAMSDIGAETWIVHGTLLGWWWNEKILPWDTDLDVQVTESTIAFLAKYYNMTEYRYRLPGIASSRRYLLEINPHYIYRDQADKLNVIDGRWIDTDTGLFIDISTVRPDEARLQAGVEGALMSKDRHHYLEEEIFPLRDAYFEGYHVKIPYQYTELLVEEYGERALTATEYMFHRFNRQSELWEPISTEPPKKFNTPVRLPPPVRISPRNGRRTR